VYRTIRVIEARADMWTRRRRQGEIIRREETELDLLAYERAQRHAVVDNCVLTPLAELEAEFVQLSEKLVRSHRQSLKRSALGR